MADNLLTDTVTTYEDLASNQEFCRRVFLGVPATVLGEQFCIWDRSVRWLQDTVRRIKESDTRGFADYYADSQPAPKETKKKFSVPESDTPMVAGKQWHLTGDFAVISDLHIPFYHAKTLERVMEESSNHGIDQLIIAGDTFDFNMFHHARGSLYQRRGQDDIKLGNTVFSALTSYFTKIFIIMGNHDLWLVKDLRNHFDAQFLFSKFFSEFPMIKWSGFGHLDVTSGTQNWKIIHGANFSEASAIGIAKKLANKFKSNVIMGHQHKVEEAVGLYHSVCIGGCHDNSRMAYTNIEPTVNEPQMRSFALLKGGKCIHITDCNEN